MATMDSFYQIYFLWTSLSLAQIFTKTKILQELFEINLTFEVNGVYQDLIGFH